jgi:hypothetical protein
LLTAVSTLEARLTNYALRALGTLDALAFDTLRTLGTLDTLAFDALAFDALRTLGTLDALAFDALAFDALRTLGALEALRTFHPLAFRPLRTFCTLKALSLRTLRTLSPLDALALGALWTLSPLASLGLALNSLARLCPFFAVLVSTFGTYRAGQRHGGDTSNQEKLASHYNLLAQSNVMNINLLSYELCLCGG